MANKAKKSTAHKPVKKGRKATLQKPPVPPVPEPVQTPTPPETQPIENKPQKKSDTTTISQRIEEVLRIRLDGAQFHDIVQYGSEKEWGITDRQIRKYVRRADDLLMERQDTNRKRAIAWHLAKRESLFARAVNAADYRTALAILADEAKLRGIYPDQYEEEKPSPMDISYLTDDQKRTLLNAMRVAEVAIAAARNGPTLPGAIARPGIIPLYPEDP